MSLNWIWFPSSTWYPSNGSSDKVYISFGYKPAIRICPSAFVLYFVTDNPLPFKLNVTFCIIVPEFSSVLVNKKVYFSPSGITNPTFPDSAVLFWL